ncbi:MAG: chemotaxis protein CheW [Planctomycetota bacterium]|jgi:purine-binding chemotaxis protein CheW
MAIAIQSTFESNGELSGLAGKYLTFQLNGEGFGLEIMKVREIIKHMKITPVPQAPDYVKGMINLRGVVIPIIDLRLRFGMEETTVTDETCIIVTEIQQDEHSSMTGIVVDNVSEVHDIKAEQIDDNSELDSFLQADIIAGICKIGDDVKILLDISKVIKHSNINHLV